MATVLSQESGKDWTIFNGDSCDVLPTLPDKSVDLSVFSPPFMALYTYSDTPRDLGNCRTLDEFLVHFRIIATELLRVTKPGRNCCVHIQDVVSTKATHGVRGIQDFTGPVIQMFQEVGFVYYSRIAIDKNPQMQAARNKVHELMFATKRRDSLSLAPVMLEYILVFKAPGENTVPVIDPIDNETWIKWAHGVWYDIRETDVLNTSVAKDNKDERHMCPLQLPTIERCVKLWTNPGEVVLSPFAGVGSELVGAIRAGRKAIGVELKPTYFNVAVRNLRNAESEAGKLELVIDDAPVKVRKPRTSYDPTPRQIHIDNTERATVKV